MVVGRNYCKTTVFSLLMSTRLSLSNLLVNDDD